MPDPVIMQKMVMEAPTTHIADYRTTVLRAPVATAYRAKPTCLMRRPPPLSDVHTLSEWKTVVPFDLLHQPRPVVQTDPWKVQKKYEKPKDSEREQAQATRPRLVMTPAVSVDDIADRRTRTLLCGDMYTSEAGRRRAGALPPCSGVRAPLPDHPAPSNPIYLPRLQPPVVSPEWRMETVQWDSRQPRVYCDATKEFWLRLQLPKCKACEESAIVTAHRRTLRQRK